MRNCKNRKKGDGGFSVRIFSNGDLNEMRVYVWSGQESLIAKPKLKSRIQTGRWYFFVLVYKESTLQVYRDGNSYAFNAQPKHWETGNGPNIPFTLRSKDDADNSTSVIFYIDEMIVRNRALTKMEINEESFK